MYYFLGCCEEFWLLVLLLFASKLELFYVRSLRLLLFYSLCKIEFPPTFFPPDFLVLYILVSGRINTSSCITRHRDHSTFCTSRFYFFLCFALIND